MRRLLAILLLAPSLALGVESSSYIGGNGFKGYKAPTTFGTSGQVLQTNGDGTTSWATSSGGGSTLQILQSSYTANAFSTTSTSFANSPLSQAITLSAGVTRVRVTVSCPIQQGTGNNSDIVYYTLDRSGTKINGAANGIMAISNLNQEQKNLSFSYIDTPGIAAPTYTLAVKSNNGVTTYVGYGAIYCLMIVEELAN